jgi:hypothetical protein
MVVPHDVTVALIEAEELPAARLWAANVGVDLSWEPSALHVRVVFTQRATGGKFYLMGTVDGYKALPPVWEFFDSTWGLARQKAFYPAPASLPGGIGSIFHTNPVICAPFNRLAYQQHGGPHSDWGGPEQWLRAGAGYVQAETLADMLAVIARDMNYSTGRMAS